MGIRLCYNNDVMLVIIITRRMLCIMGRVGVKWQTVLQPRHILAEQHRQEEAVSGASFTPSPLA